MSFMDNSRIGKLRCTFPKLTETNQCYVLGLAEGLKQAQGKTRNAGSGKAAGEGKGERCVHHK